MHKLRKEVHENDKRLEGREPQEKQAGLACG